MVDKAARTLALDLTDMDGGSKEYVLPVNLREAVA